MPSKSRELNRRRYGGTQRNKNGAIIFDNSSKFIEGKGYQVTDSEGHVRDRKTGQYHEGGPFYSYRCEYDIPAVNVKVKDWTGAVFTGAAHSPLPGTPSVLQPATSFRSKTDFGNLDKKGATAIAQCAPTNSNAELGTALAEIIHERRLPSVPGIQLWKRRTEVAKAAGSEYLNLEFAWKPTVSDIKNVGSAARHSRDILKQYERDEGRNVRREFSYPIDSSFSSSTGAEAIPRCGPGDVPGLEGKHGKLVVSSSSETRMWFKGSFTYTSSSQGDSWQKAYEHGSNADKLFGVSLDPDTVWELAPWSWAVDWVSNTGDVIHNVNEMILGGLVMRYGFMMEETKSTVSYSIEGAQYSNCSLTSTPPARFTQVCKVRRPANPFGFGLTWEGLSPTQLAIAAALGITHLR